MSDTRPTPRTDKSVFYLNDDNFTPVVHKVVAQALERERDELAKWKNEQMLVESQWDTQAVAKELGMTAGADIRKNILPAIQQLKRERDEAREELARMQTMAAGVADILAKRDAMLEAIREASVLIADCSGRASDATLQMHANNDAKGIVDDVWLWSEKALAKLKPFLP
jgi:hypothetical protein